MMLMRYRFIAAITFSLVTFFAGGCEKAQNDSSHAAVAPAPAAALKVAVVDDPALALALGKVRGEWRAQSGAELEIQELTASAAASTEKLDADTVLYPLGLLGTLAERKLIRPLNAAWLSADPLDAGDLLAAPDSPEFMWDGQPYAVPLGEPVFVLAYSADLFAKFGKQPPRTWEEYQALVDFFAGRGAFSATLEPLADGWPSQLLLARAAAYAKHRDYFSVLFDRETMKPLIAGPPFVKALTQLVAAAKSAHFDLTKLTPADTLKLLRINDCAMAICCPSGAAEGRGSQAEKSMSTDSQVTFVELPGAQAAYNLGHSTWEDRAASEPQQVTLRGISGLAGSVVRGSEHAEAAFGFLAWLSSKRWSGEILPASPESAMFRRSQLEEPGVWTGGSLTTSQAKQYAAVLSEALLRRETMLAPRIPDVAEYLAALDEAVLAAVKGKQAPQQALDAAAAQWEKITDRLGREKQLEAYRRSMKGVR